MLKRGEMDVNDQQSVRSLSWSVSRHVWTKLAYSYVFMIYFPWINTLVTFFLLVKTLSCIHYGSCWLWIKYCTPSPRYPNNRSIGMLIYPLNIIVKYCISWKVCTVIKNIPPNQWFRVTPWLFSTFLRFPTIIGVSMKRVLHYAYNLGFF